MGSVKLAEVGLRSGTKWDLKGRTQVVQIIISYGASSITSLQFQYLENGLVIASPIIGCQNFSGPKFDAITFHGPDEYITKVEGIGRESSIEKLSLHTNKNLYQIFEANIPPSRFAVAKKMFSYNFGGANQFGGFYGTHTPNEVTSIGFYFNHLTALPSKSK